MEAGYVSISNSHGGRTGAIAIVDGSVRASRHLFRRDSLQGPYSWVKSVELPERQHANLAPGQLKSKELLGTAGKSEQETHPP
jgi:hypothetical protein